MSNQDIQRQIRNFFQLPGQVNPQQLTHEQQILFYSAKRSQSLSQLANTSPPTPQNVPLSSQGLIPEFVMHQSIATAVEQPYPINTSMPPLTLQNNYQPQQVLPEPPTDPSTQDEESSREAPMYVNHKQYHRIIKRREARAKFEAARTKGKGDKKDKGYIHESRHKHAMTRPRGPGGRFLPATPTPSVQS